MKSFSLRCLHARVPPSAKVDGLVYALIVGLGALQFALPLAEEGFFRGDTIYLELARSLLDKGSYGLDFNEVIYPPGLPALMALLCSAVGCSHSALVRPMAVFGTLALLLAYRLLRRETDRRIAAVACLLIASSPVLFALSTQWVFSDLPYFCTSMLVLVVATKLDTAGSLKAQIALGVLCASMLVLSLLFRSSGVALVAGLAGWLVVGSLWTDPELRRRRLKRFFAVLLVGIVVQAAWMARVSRHESVDWPMLEGHPRSYVSQFKVKSGIQPELGTASIAEVFARAPANVATRSAGLMELLTHKDYLDPAWYSPLVLGTVLLTALGLGASLRPVGGGLAEWYFIGNEAMYLLWPWPFEMRFLIPVAPLACLYLWRGGIVIWRIVGRTPRAVGIAGLPIGLLAGLSAGGAAWAVRSSQAMVYTLLWAVVVVAAVWLAIWARPRHGGIPLHHDLHTTKHLQRGRDRVNLPRLGVGATLAGFVAVGIFLQLRIGLQNRTFDVTAQPAYSRVVASRWIADHTSPTAVVMARQLDVVHHYAKRKVVWFAPISDPRVLMQGIRRLGVDYVVVTNIWDYYLPSEQDCINAVLLQYPRSFRIAHEGPRFKIIEVIRDALVVEDNGVLRGH